MAWKAYLRAVTVDMSARYAQAEAMLPAHLKAKVNTPQVRPNWIRGTNSFWYAKEGQYLIVDADARTERPAFDQSAVADELTTLLGTEVTPTALPVEGLVLTDDGVLITLFTLRLSVSAGGDVAVI